MLSANWRQQNVLIMLNVEMVHVSVLFNLFRMRRKYAVRINERNIVIIQPFIYSVDPCPKPALNRVKIRYPGHCRRFIDCKKRYVRSKTTESVFFHIFQNEK